MDEKTVRALVEAGAVKNVLVVGDGATVHIDIVTANDRHTVTTTKGVIKTWASIDTSARWLKNLGIGKAQLDIARWSPGQRPLDL